jgi:hypothetical protein
MSDVLITRLSTTAALHAVMVLSTLCLQTALPPGLWRCQSRGTNQPFTAIRRCPLARFTRTTHRTVQDSRPRILPGASLCIATSNASPLPRIGSVQRDDCATAPLAARPSPIRKRRTRAIAYYLCAVNPAPKVEFGAALGLTVGQIHENGCWTGSTTIQFGAGPANATTPTQKYQSTTFTGTLSYQMLMTDDRIIRIDNLDRVTTLSRL